MFSRTSPTPLAITPIAREVWERTASAATIEGSIAALGAQYVIGLKAIDCRSGNVLADEQVTASGKEQVLKSLGQAAAMYAGSWANRWLRCRSTTYRELG